MKIVRTNKVQMSCFFRDNNIKSFELISKLYEKLYDVFHSEPQTMPLPDDAPKDLPRCVWNSPNVVLTLSLLKLDMVFNVKTDTEWNKFVFQYAHEINAVLQDSQIEICRIGIVTDNMADDDLHGILNDRVTIDKFQEAKELNVSWLENVEKSMEYNVWTHIFIDENNSNYSIVFDVNSVADDNRIDMTTALPEAVGIMEGKMEYVL